MPKSFRLPPNPEIVAEIIERYRDRGVVGASWMFGRRYLLTPEDREDLAAHANYKIARVDWRSKFRATAAFVNEHYPSHPATWTARELAGFFNGYVFTLIRKAMLDEVRRIRCQGRTGLGLHPVDEIAPLHQIVADADEDASGDDEWGVDAEAFSRDGQESRIGAAIVAERARALLSPEEWSAVSLAFGFDGGGERTVAQVAREARIPRREAQRLLDSAMRRMREAAK